MNIPPSNEHRDSRDPRPVPPEPPPDDACCGNGCDPCVFDLHDAAVDRYRAELRAWTARQASQTASPEATGQWSCGVRAPW